MRYFKISPPWDSKQGYISECVLSWTPGEGNEFLFHICFPLQFVLLSTTKINFFVLVDFGYIKLFMNLYLKKYKKMSLQEMNLPSLFGHGYFNHFLPFWPQSKMVFLNLFKAHIYLFNFECTQQIKKYSHLLYISESIST